ncbi:MAG: heat-inducible transcriptional repressor HrcA [Clostridiales bacterium]|nr:heat-inducible transcriptional repressor HrcA [Clostridiales bacterium]
MISDRRHTILNLIIEHYLATGEPIGSKAICQLLPYPVSSATVRNEMAYLSQLGYLEQRYTSGGRVPSKASYRYYVDSIMRENPVPEYDKQRIDETLSVYSGDPERLLNSASKLMSEYSNCASFCCMLEDTADCVRGVELIPAGGSRTMLVMVTAGSRIKSSLVNMTCPADDEFRALFYGVVNKFFIGARLVDITPAFIQSTAVYAQSRIFDLLPVLISLCSLCSEASQNTLTLEGETNLLSHEELGTGVYRLLSFLTEKQQLIRTISEFANSSKSREFFIGEENPLYEMKETATAVAKYTYPENQKAVIGIIGSMRIDYKNIIPKIRYIADTVDTLLSKGGMI